MINLRTLPPPTPAPAQPRVERLVELLVVMSSCLLEVLPIFCWLLLLAAYDTADPNNVAMPFWWMWVLVVAVRWLGAWFIRDTDADPGRRRRHTLLLTLTVAVLGPLSLYVTYLLSPTTQAFLVNGSDTGGPVALALLVAWFWWRGLSLSRGRITRERMYIRFVLALGGTIAALAGAAAIQGEARALATGYLSILLAALLFTGTLGLTLAQARDATYELRVSYHGNQPLVLPPLFTRSWLAASLGLSVGLSFLALLLATIFSRQSVQVLAVAAGNIANGLISAVEFVLMPVFYLIYLVLNKPVEWLAQFFHHLPPRPRLTPPPPPSCTQGAVATPVGGGSGPQRPCVPPAHVPTTGLLPAEWLTALRWGTVILIVVVTLIVLARALNRFFDLRRVREYSEERAMLDVREILGSQLRRFFNAFQASSPDELGGDALVAGSVRQVYRETLAAAAAAGRARRESETPLEYQRRITSADPLQATQPLAVPPPHVASALERLTQTYEQARYGHRSHPPDEPAGEPADTSPPALPDTLDAAATVRRWLADQQSSATQAHS